MEKTKWTLHALINNKKKFETIISEPEYFQVLAKKKLII